MNRTEKAVKGLQREREVEEGEHRSTGELVLELREVSEVVQVVESLQREVEQLEEKLAELGSRVREGHLGLQHTSGIRQFIEGASRAPPGCRRRAAVAAATTNSLSCQPTAKAVG